MTENNLRSETQAPAPKKSRKTPIIIAVAAVVVIAAVLIAVFVGGSGSPLALVAKGADNTMDAMMENRTVVLLKDIMTHGSIDVTADLAPLTESALGYAMNGKVTASLLFSDKHSMALSADVTLGTTPLLDAVMVMSAQDIAVASQALLGDAAYGVDLEALPENFGASVFGPNGAYSLGMTTDEVRQIVDGLKTNEELPAELEGILKDFFTTAAASIGKNSEISDAKSSLTFAGEACKTTAVTIAMDADGLCNVAEDILTYLDTNQKLRTFLYAHSAGVDEALAAEALDEFYAGISEALASMDEMRAEAKADNIALSITLHVTESGSYLVAAVMDFSSTESSCTVEAMIGPDPRDPREITTRMTSDFAKYDISYTVVANNRDSYSGQLNASVDGQSVLAGSVNWNKGSGVLLVEMSAEGEAVSCSGTLTHSDEAEVFTILSVNDGYEDIPLGVTVTLNRSAQFPELPAYTDLLTMSEAEIDQLLNGLSTAAMGLLFSLG